MSNKNIWNKYSNEGIIGMGRFGKVYKAKDNITKKIYAIKEINKIETSELKFNEEIKNIKKLESENSISIIEEIKTNDNYYYIVLNYCLFNLQTYLELKNENLTIEEIKSVLLQLNNTFKKMKELGIIHRDIKPSNILLNIDKLDKVSIKLSDYGSSINIKNITSKTNTGTQFTMAPEVLEKNSYSEKSDIWSLGVTIYYMLFRDYPFQGDTEMMLFNNIKNNKNIKSSGNNLLDDLLSKMLCFNVLKRIDWNKYFEHVFFKKENDNNNYNNNNNKTQNLNFPNFNFYCNSHSEIIKYYCVKCKKNICENCTNQHQSHQIILLSEIGLSKNEINKIDNILNDMNLNIEKFKQIQKEIKLFYDELKQTQQNISIFSNDPNNDIKNYLIKFLLALNDKIKTDSIKNFQNFINNISYTKLKLIDNYNEHSYISSMANFPSGNLITVSGDSKIKIYNNFLNLIQEIDNAHKKSIQNVSIKDENNFVTCSVDLIIKTWIKRNKYELNIIIDKAHKQNITNVIYVFNNLVSCSFDNTIKIWELKNNEYISIKTLTHSNWVSSILFSKEKQILISAGSDGLKFWNYENYNLICDFKEIKCIGKNNLKKIDDDKIIVARKDEIINMISIKDKKIIKEIKINITCYCICVIPKINILLFGGEGKDIFIYNLEKFNYINVVKNAHNDDILCISELKYGNIISSSEDNTLKIWSF